MLLHELYVESVHAALVPGLEPTGAVRLLAADAQKSHSAELLDMPALVVFVQANDPEASATLLSVMARLARRLPSVRSSHEYAILVPFGRMKCPSFEKRLAGVDVPLEIQA